MKSPFPGMDPYLEQHWPDVHAKLVTYAADMLNEQLPEQLVARTEERIAVEFDEGEPDRVTPDVRVLQAVERDVVARSVGGVTITAPIRLVAMIEPLTERYIEIIDATGNRLVTVIEVLSPANKRGEGLKAFRKKREELVEGGVHFVEIDLVRQGDWQALLRPHRYGKRLTTAYRATVRLASDSMAVYVYPISLEDRLPRLPVPLRPTDPEVALDLQPLLDAAYRNGRYATTLDYKQPCDPPLEGDWASWADVLLKTAGKRRAQ